MTSGTWALILSALVLAGVLAVALRRRRDALSLSVDPAAPAGATAPTPETTPAAAPATELRIMIPGEGLNADPGTSG